MDSQVNRLGLFEGFGIEIEYMLVDRETLNVRPICDRVLASLAEQTTTRVVGEPPLQRDDFVPVNEVTVGECCWSNELVLHVIELKTDGPVSTLEGVADRFSFQIRSLNTLLRKYDACLMPTGMHPWMNPSTETHLWPHENNEIYSAYDRIFGCQGHGWSNLQSMHLNLPFANEEEFVRLHAAIRILLPLLPALAASSPLVECQVTGLLDNRLEFYRHNQKRIPVVTGLLVPEPVRSIDEYHEHVLNRIYAELAPYDPEGILCEEWVNSRGAITRFERNTIEIRLLDTQESPYSDLAIASLLVEVLKKLVAGEWSSSAQQNEYPTEALHESLLATIRDGDQAILEQLEYLTLLGLPPDAPCQAGWVWKALLTRLPQNEHSEFQELPLSKGCLAGRIRNNTGSAPSRRRIEEVYHQLCACLEERTFFE